MDTKYKVVVTHDGLFHIDELIAICIWFLVFVNTTIKRSRNPQDWVSADALIDVGGEADMLRNRFDHHQRGGAGSRPNGIPYASAGLVWLKYGEQACRSVLEQYFGVDFDYRSIADKIDTDLISLIDANDTGSSKTQTVFDCLRQFNEPWFIEKQDHDYQFAEALAVAKQILHNTIISVGGDFFAQERLKGFIAGQEGDEVVILNDFVPWSSIIHNLAPLTKFVVFPDKASGTWRVQGVPKEPGSFELKARLPVAWGGLKRDELVEITGCSSAIFAHPNGFIMGAGSMEDAVTCAFLALLKLGEPSVPQE